ncbi:MAG: sugar transferase, partial [Acidobacteriaceae bacterium]|nr:sugar transferase [Acidobacteriaceae bacterium]
MFYRRYGKRAIDLCVAAVTLVVLSPVIALTALGVRLFLGSPVLFRQMRPGLHERPFTVLKFRTLTDRRDREGTLL